MSRPVSLAVVGLGSIAQIQHLPNLARLGDLFRVRAVADISPRLVAAIADRLPADVLASTDWRKVCSHPEVEAVLLLTSGAHEQVTEAALGAGNHVFAEKPLCLTVEAARRLHELADGNGLALQVGYMKLHEQIVADLRSELESIGELRLLRHSVYHPQDRVVLSHTDTLRFDDPDPAVLAEAAAFEKMRTAEALGDLPSEWGRLYRNVLAASLIHSVSFLRGVMGGLPRLTHADMWPPAASRPEEPPCLLARGRYPDHTRVEMSWLWLPSYPAYRESFEAHGTEGSVQVSFPNPYLAGEGASLTVRHSGGVTRQAGDESPFVRELRAFHAAIVSGRHPQDGMGAGEDIAWLQDMVATLVLEEGMTAGGEAAGRR